MINWFSPDHIAQWRAACVSDATLAAFEGQWAISFAIQCDDRSVSFSFENGRVLPKGDDPAFTFAAPEPVWRKFLLPIPPRHHHVPLAMLARVPEATLLGDKLAHAQHCHLLRRVVEIGKYVALGNVPPVPPTLRASLAKPDITTTARTVTVEIAGQTCEIHTETVGSGQDILCLHTAGADLRQFHRLMADERLTAQHRLTAFDLPWHGRSGPGPMPWRLTTDYYVAAIMAVITAAGLRRPIILGASMSGEICLELAYRFPRAFRAIIACEAAEKITGRQVPYAFHPQVNQALFVPEWIHGLMAPQSPAECAQEVLWHYGQGGPGVFAGDIHFYAGEWDASDRVGRIDTSECPLFMLTGEYDYSCTTELSAATAAKIPGVHYQPMPGIGHFPFAENPPRFLEFLLPILNGLPANQSRSSDRSVGAV